jgi:Nif-specific regulatory protein
MSGKAGVALSDLPLYMRDHSIKARFTVHMKDALPSTIEDIEKTKILDALEKTGWVQAKAAKVLGITPRQIGYKMKKYDLQQGA